MIVAGHLVAVVPAIVVAIAAPRWVDAGSGAVAGLQARATHNSLCRTFFFCELCFSRNFSLMIFFWKFFFLLFILHFFYSKPIAHTGVSANIFFVNFHSPEKKI